MRLDIFAALILILTVAHPTSAAAQRRVALVIGNSAYQNVPKLSTTANDARAVAARLRNAGFDVVESRNDLGIANMRRAFRDFNDIARDADVGVVYYAGHGIEVDGTNYLVPVDAVFERDTDVEDEAVSVDRLMKLLDPVKRLRLVILDACRDNPFSRTMKRTIASVSRGLAKFEPVTSDTLISFAARAGSTAIDGDGPNSPFTTALVQHLTTPGLDLRLAFGRIRDEVMKATSNRQEPFVYGSLGGSNVSLVPAPEPKVAAPIASSPAPTDKLSDARRDYEFVERMGTKEAWSDFLELHPSGLYANLARQQLAKLLEGEKKASEQAKANAEKAAAEKTTAEQAKVAAQATENATATGKNDTFTTQPATIKRVALVIGNGAYRNAAHLPNPTNDAQDVAAALKRLGFETILGIDLDRAGMDDYAVRFARAAWEADVALFYYSGHAMQFAGINYLMPIDARLTDEADLRRLSRVDDIVADLQQAKNLRILVLDSCRNNPLAEEALRWPFTGRNHIERLG